MSDYPEPLLATPASGTCGAPGNESGVTWSLDENGVLTISGSGAMANWGYNGLSYDYAPWHTSSSVVDEVITEVVIENGVTSIGDYAFGHCGKLTRVTIPNSVTVIGEDAFGGCSALTTIALPARITEISNAMFAACSSLTEIEIPAGVTTIGYQAFANCTSLTRVEIPAGVISIGVETFLDCTSLTEIVIPAGMTTIENEVFKGCTSLTKVEIGAGTPQIASIGENAFRGCTKLESVQIPKSVKKISRMAFKNCDAHPEILYDGTKKEWESILIEDRYLDYTGIPTIKTSDVPEGFRATDHTGMAKLIFRGYGIQSFEEKMPFLFVYRDSDGTFGELPLPAFGSKQVVGWNFYATQGGYGTAAGNTEIAQIRQDAYYSYEDDDGQYGKLTNINAITTDLSKLNITYNASAKTCRINGFKSGYAGSSTLYIPGTVEKDGQTYQVTEIAAKAFTGNTRVVNVIILDGVQQIGDAAFDGCALLESITLADSIETIGRRAFADCPRLGAVTLPAGLRNFGVITAGGVRASQNGEVFQGCNTLEQVVFRSVVDIPRRTFEDCIGLRSVTFCNDGGSYTIGEAAFDGCRNLCGDGESLVLPAGLTEIGPGAFAHCCHMELASGIPSTVTKIGPYAFIDCASLDSVTLPDALTVLETGVFQGCSNLSNVTIGAGSRLTGIGSHAFLDCESLETIDIPINVTVVKDLAFGRCVSLRSIVLPRMVTRISENAFLECRTLKTAYIPASVSYLGDGAFRMCGVDNEAVGGAKMTITYGGTREKWQAASAQRIVCDQYAKIVYEGGDTYVTLYGNGGSVNGQNRIELFVNPQPQSTYGVLPVPTRAGYNFLGWYTAPEGGEQVASDTAILIQDGSILPLYAHWAAVETTVTLDPGYEGGTSATITVTYGGLYSSLSAKTPSRVGYVFSGWYTAAEGGTQVTAETAVTAVTDHTLYARWTAVTSDPKNEITINDEASAIELEAGAAVPLTTDFKTPNLSANQKKAVYHTSVPGVVTITAGKSAGTATVTAQKAGTTTVWASYPGQDSEPTSNAITITVHNVPAELSVLPGTDRDVYIVYDGTTPVDPVALTVQYYPTVAANRDADPELTWATEGTSAALNDDPNQTGVTRNIIVKGYGETTVTTTAWHNAESGTAPKQVRFTIHVQKYPQEQIKYFQQGTEFKLDSKATEPMLAGVPITVELCDKANGSALALPYTIELASGTFEVEKNGVWNPADPTEYDAECKKVSSTYTVSVPKSDDAEITGFRFKLRAKLDGLDDDKQVKTSETIELENDSRPVSWTVDFEGGVKGYQITQDTAGGNITALTFNSVESEAEPEKTAALKPAAIDWEDKPYNATYTYSSTNPDVISVDEQGVLTLGKTGTANVTVQITPAPAGAQPVSRTISVRVVKEYEVQVRETKLTFNSAKPDERFLTLAAPHGSQILVDDEHKPVFYQNYTNEELTGVSEAVVYRAFAPATGRLSVDVNTDGRKFKGTLWLKVWVKVGDNIVEAKPVKVNFDVKPTVPAASVKWNKGKMNLFYTEGAEAGFTVTVKNETVAAVTLTTADTQNKKTVSDGFVLSDTAKEGVWTVTPKPDTYTDYLQNADYKDWNYKKLLDGINVAYTAEVMYAGYDLPCVVKNVKIPVEITPPAVTLTTAKQINLYNSALLPVEVTVKNQTGATVLKNSMEVTKTTVVNKTDIHMTMKAVSDPGETDDKAYVLDLSELKALGVAGTLNLSYQPKGETWIRGVDAKLSVKYINKMVKPTLSANKVTLNETWSANSGYNTSTAVQVSVPGAEELVLYEAAPKTAVSGITIEPAAEPNTITVTLTNHNLKTGNYTFTLQTTFKDKNNAEAQPIKMEDCTLTVSVVNQEPTVKIAPITLDLAKQDQRSAKVELNVTDAEHYTVQISNIIWKKGNYATAPRPNPASEDWTMAVDPATAAKGTYTFTATVHVMGYTLSDPRLNRDYDVVFNVTVKDSTPTFKLSKSTLTLNRALDKPMCETSIIIPDSAKQQFGDFTGVVVEPENLKGSFKITRTTVEGGLKVTFQPLADTNTGTYKLKVQAVTEDGLRSKAQNLTLKVENKNPTVKALNGTAVTLNANPDTLSTRAAFTLTNVSEYGGYVPMTSRANPDRIVVTPPKGARADDLNVSLDKNGVLSVSSNRTPGGKYTISVTPLLQGTNAALNTVKLTVNSATKAATVSAAAGKEKLNLQDRGNTYTTFTIKRANTSAAVCAVELDDASAAFFKLEDFTPLPNGDATVKLKLLEDVSWNKNQSVPVSFNVTLDDDAKTVLPVAKKITVKPIEYSLKGKSSLIGSNVIYKNAAGQTVQVHVELTAPKVNGQLPKISGIALVMPKTLADKPNAFTASAPDENGNFTITLNDLSVKAAVYELTALAQPKGTSVGGGYSFKVKVEVK